MVKYLTVPDCSLNSKLTCCLVPFPEQENASAAGLSSLDPARRRTKRHKALFKPCPGFNITMLSTYI